MPEVQTTPVPSPCVRCCCLDEADICLGCYRSLDEIIAWSAADGTRRQEILMACAERRARMSR